MEKTSVAARPIQVNQGFTLIEILVVVSLISLLFAAVAINTKATLQRARFQHDVDQFVADYKLCRTYTLNTGRVCSLEIGRSGSEYKFELPDVSQKQKEEPKAFVKRLHNAKIVSIESVASRKRLRAIEFTIDGHAPTMIVRFQGPAEKSYQILLPGLYGESIRQISENESRSFQNALSS
jgi:prepilin-type N-terminal cleavage/methylation domain-containing protein